jgi:hypothetical protein
LQKKKKSLFSHLDFREQEANLAQLVEQLICNQQVIGSSPIVGSQAGIVNIPAFLFICKVSKLTLDT